jgi:hypothetical protein
MPETQQDTLGSTEILIFKPGKLYRILQECYLIDCKNSKNPDRVILNENNIVLFLGLTRGSSIKEFLYNNHIINDGYLTLQWPENYFEEVETE